MIGSLSKVVLSSSPVKLTSINGQINGKCIFTDQNELSLIEGSFDRSTPLGKTKIITKDKIMVVNQKSEGETTNQVTVLDLEKKFRLFGTIPKNSLDSESFSKMIVDQIEKDGIIWHLMTPFRYSKDIVQKEVEAEAHFSNGCLKAVVMNGYILFGKSTPVTLIVDEEEFTVQYISMDSNIIIANGEAWRLNTDFKRIERSTSL